MFVSVTRECGLKRDLSFFTTARSSPDSVYIRHKSENLSQEHHQNSWFIQEIGLGR